MRPRAMIQTLVATALALSPASAFAEPAAPPKGLTVEKVVLLMRHGIRPPTKSPAMPAGIASEAWPNWPVKPGWLTPRGAEAISWLGASDGAGWRASGLLPKTGCPAAGTVEAIADSDQRTIATADAWLAALAPGCGLASSHQPQDVEDPIFSPSFTGFDRQRADVAVVEEAGAGGIARLEQRYRSLLTRLDAILCGNAKVSCGVGGMPSSIVPSGESRYPKLSGALDKASTAAQILLLEYAEGKPMSEVGWGRATRADVSALSAFHALEFRLLARPRYLAGRKLAGITPLIRAGLAGPARITLILGHDTNVASLGGLLGVHWRVPGLVEDDPAPGGAIILQQLRDSSARTYVRALYRSQTLDQLRNPKTAGSAGQPYMSVLPIPGCAARGIQGLCETAAFEAKLAV